MTIEELIDHYSTYIYNFALKLSCHPTSAEDLTQQTFIKAWEKLDTLKNPDSVKTWLRQICYHLFLMQARKIEPTLLSDEKLIALENEGTHLFSDFVQPEEEVLVEESIKELQNGCFLAMVRKLTLHQRLAFSLVDMFGLSISEAANIIGVSEKATKGLLYRSRMNLDSFFHDHCQLINTNNPCSCRAWQAFSKQKTKLKQSVRGITLVTHLDHIEKNYTYNAETRSKIHYLYAHMPEKKPPKEWYDNIISLLRLGNLNQ